VHRKESANCLNYRAVFSAILHSETGHQNKPTKTQTVLLLSFICVYLTVYVCFFSLQNPNSCIAKIHITTTHILRGAENAGVENAGVGPIGNFRGVGIGYGSRGNNLGRLVRSVHRGATCWLRNGAMRT